MREQHAQRTAYPEALNVIDFDVLVIGNYEFGGCLNEKIKSALLGAFSFSLLTRGKIGCII